MAFTVTRFQVLTEVLLDIWVFWDVTPCNLFIWFKSNRKKVCATLYLQLHDHMSNSYLTTSYCAATSPTCILHENTGCFKKSFTTLKAYRNLYRGHTQRFELSKCSKTHRVLPRWLSWTSNEALPKLFYCSVRNTWPTGWLGMALAVAVLGTTVPRAWKVSCNSCE